MKSINLHWFNLNPNFQGKIFGQNFKWFNCFHRKSTDGLYWGFGIFQIGKRHLFYVGFTGVSILFIGTH